MSICFDGIGEVAATFRMKEGAQLKQGNAVTLTGNGEMGLGSGSDPLCGIVLHTEKDGCASVQIGGLAEIACSGGTAPAVGRQTLCVDGAGKVQTTDSGAEFMVLSVDETTMTAVIQL